MKAFSLIEVMIASAMLSIGLAAVLTAHGTATSLESHQERLSQAMHLAEARMEALLLAYPDDADLATGTHTPLLFDSQGEATAATPFYSVGWAVDAGPIPRTRRLQITVTWVERTTNQQLVLTSHRS